MTIEDLINKYDEDDYDSIVLDYEGDIEEFECKWDMDDCLFDEEATGKIVNRKLIIKVE
jgi:hypothetical protein